MPKFSITVDERKGNPFWWATVYIGGEGGKKHRFSTRVRVGAVSDRHESKREATRQAESRARGLPGIADADSEAPRSHALIAVGERMLDYKRADGKRERAVDSHGFCLDKYVVPFLGETRDVTTIRRADLESFKVHLDSKGYAPQTINNALTSIRQVLKYACTVEELIESVPTVLNVKRVNEPKGRALRPEQIQALLAAVDPRAVEALHFLTFIANTGLRKSEALAIRFSWVNWRDRYVEVPAAFNKGGRKRPAIALNDVTLQVLRERLALQYKRAKPDDDRVFRQIKHDVARNSAAARAELGHVTNHDLRHSLGSLRVEAGATLTEVRDDLGHVTMAMVSHYQHSHLERRQATADLVQLSAAVPGTVPGRKGSRRGTFSNSAQQEKGSRAKK